MSQNTSRNPRRSAGLAGAHTRRAHAVAARSAGFADTSAARRAGMVAVAGLVTAGVGAPLANAAATVPAGASSYATASAASSTTTTSGSQSQKSESGTRYTSVALNVRTGASLDSKRVTTLAEGTKVTTTGATSGDWTQIEHDGGKRWVATRYLTSTAPSEAATSRSTDTTSRSTTREAISTQTVDTSNLDAQRAAIVKAAYSAVGTGYVYGGTSYGAWDCSGFVLWATKQAGITGLPRTASAQAAALTPTSNPQPGDLVLQNGGGHIGIYVGDGMMISALNADSGTQLHPVDWMPVVGYYTYN